MTFLATSGGPDGGLWVVADGAGPRRIADIPDTSFAMRLPDGCILALSGGAEGRVQLLEPHGDAFRERDSASSGGGEPCFAVLDPSGTHIVIVNYGPPGVGVWRIGSPLASLTTTALRAGGSGAVPDRQESSHPHHAVFISPDEMLIADLGADAILRCQWHGGTVRHTGTVHTPAGSGPRHLAVAGELLVASAELSNEVLATTLTELRRADGPGVWTRSAATTHGEAASSRGDRISYPGDIAIDSLGDVLLANRGADTITRLRYDSGRLRTVEERAAGGRWPQRILVDGDRVLLAVRDSDAVFDGAVRIADVPMPTWIGPW